MSASDRARLAVDALREASDRAGVAELVDDVLTSLAGLLREMDRTQQETDEGGGREVAWYYYRERFEDALGLEHGALDTEAPDGE